MRQEDRTLQETITSLPPGEVLASAKQFFSRRNSIYAAYLEKEGPTFVAMRGQGGEEIVIGVRTLSGDGSTGVTGSSYMFDQQVARFFATLPPAGTSGVGAGGAGSAGVRAAGAGSSP
jgi:hypothetical protein